MTKYDQRKQDGTCVKCGKVPSCPGKTLCYNCADRHKKVIRDRSDRNKSKGLCTKCGRSTDTGNQCLDCRAKKKKYIKSYCDKEVCRTCGTNQPVEGKLSCQSCLNYLKERYDTRVINGQCVRCGNKELIPDRKMCETCLLKSRAKVTLKDTSKWSIMKSIWDHQGGVCPYSGEAMTIGESALDHKVPQSKDGTHEEDNLQFVLYDINKMKSNLSEERFLLLVKKIYEYRNLG